MRKKTRKILFSSLLSLFIITSCDKSDMNVETFPPTITLSDEDGIYEVKVNKTITLKPSVDNAQNAFCVWKYKGKIVSRDSVYEFCSHELGQHFITFSVDAANGSVEQEMRVDVLEKTPPQVQLPLEGGYVRIYQGREATIEPTVKFGENASFQWYLDGKEISKDKSLLIKKDEMNDFKLRLDVTNADGLKRVEATLRVSEIPELSFAFDQEEYSVALGQSIVLSPSVSYGKSGTTYKWSVDGTPQIGATTKAFRFTPNAIGEYKIKISGTSSENSAEKEISVKCIENINFFRAATSASSATQIKCFEYTAAPGQFVNKLPAAGITPEEAAAAAEAKINTNSMITLGAFGGFVVVGFDHSVVNKEAAKDLWIGGNAFATSNEPAIVWVMQDVNGDGQPNDLWYELKGSEYGLEETIQGYTITYYAAEARENVRWTDNLGNAGTVDANSFHGQRYYPNWINKESYTLTGSCLKPRTEDQSASYGSEYWSNKPFGWGYVDNSGSDYVNGGTEFDVDNAVNGDGTPANLEHIDFVKIQTAVNAKAGWLGEVSTEVIGIKDLNL